MASSDSRSEAFTMVELLAVMAIMGIIAALVVVAAAGARKRTDSDSAKAGIQYIAARIDAYRNKRGQLPPNLNEGVGAGLDDITTEQEIYDTLGQWGFEVPAEKQVDPWGNPYVVVLSRDYGKDFPIVSGAVTGEYTKPPFSREAAMYGAAADMPKDIRDGDPTTQPAYMDEYDGFQIVSAGPDGQVRRDNREMTDDIDGNGASDNADNFTNWER